jgi:hypothetical protein
VRETVEKAKSDDGQAAIAASGPSTSSVAATSIDVNSFERVFAVACKSSWEAVLADKVLKIGNSRHGALLLELAASLRTHLDDMRCLPITDCFRSVFVNKLLMTVGERELMRQIHEIPTSPAVASA